MSYSLFISVYFLLGSLGDQTSCWTGGCVSPPDYRLCVNVCCDKMKKMEWFRKSPGSSAWVFKWRWLIDILQGTIIHLSLCVRCIAGLSSGKQWVFLFVFFFLPSVCQLLAPWIYWVWSHVGFESDSNLSATSLVAATDDYKIQSLVTVETSVIYFHLPTFNFKDWRLSVCWMYIWKWTISLLCSCSWESIFFFFFFNILVCCFGSVNKFLSDDVCCEASPISPRHTFGEMPFQLCTVWSRVSWLTAAVWVLLSVALSNRRTTTITVIYNAEKRIKVWN